MNHKKNIKSERGRTPTAGALLCACVALTANGCVSTAPGSASFQAHTVLISGRVVDEAGNGIFGATITHVAQAKRFAAPRHPNGDSTGVTDFTGSYQIRVPVGEPVSVAVQHVDYDFKPRIQSSAQSVGDIEISFQGTARIARTDWFLPDGRIAVASSVESVRIRKDDGEAPGGQVASGAVTVDAPAVGGEPDPVEESAKPILPAAECRRASDCADGHFCSGRERCLAGICISTGNPCPVGVTCDEEADACRFTDASSWTPPIGIPQPSFGITETAPDTPDPWDSGKEGFYYVDREHSDATDMLNTYGHPGRPRRTIPAHLPAGSLVELHGRYDREHAGGRRIRGDGTRDMPIFIRGKSSGDAPVITRRFQVSAQYMILENLTFADGDGDLTGGDVGTPIILGPANHVVLRYCDVSGNLSSGGTGVGSWTNDTCEDVVIYRNMIHDNGDWHANYDQDRHGVNVFKGASSVWIVDNEFYHNSGDGVQVGKTEMEMRPHHIYVGRNIAWENKQIGFWVKTADDVVISQNVARDHVPSDSSPGSGIGWQYDGRRLWILFNKLYDNTLGIRGASANEGGADDVYLIGNVIHDTNGWAIDVWSQHPNVHIVGNTIFETRGGIKGQQSRAFLLANNIIVNTGDEPHVAITGKAWQRTSIDHCLLFSRDGSIRIQWGSRLFNTVGALKGFMGQCAYCIEADPLFADVAGRDFRLLPESPAVDAGAADDVYATFERLYGIDISTGFGAGVRQEGQLFDIGAFEFLPNP